MLMGESWWAMAQEGEGPREPPVGRSDSTSERRVARGEINRRRVNEAIDRGGRSGAPRVFVCECGRIGCNTTVRLSLDEYENVRTSFERFLVAPGHDVAGIEDVIERYGSHHVVAKRATARELARDADERRPDGVA